MPFLGSSKFNKSYGSCGHSRRQGKVLSQLQICCTTTPMGHYKGHMLSIETICKIHTLSHLKLAFLNHQIRPHIHVHVHTHTQYTPHTCTNTHTHSLTHSHLAINGSYVYIMCVVKWRLHETDIKCTFSTHSAK